MEVPAQPTNKLSSSITKIYAKSTFSFKSIRSTVNVVIHNLGIGFHFNTKIAYTPSPFINHAVKTACFKVISVVISIREMVGNYHMLTISFSIKKCLSKPLFLLNVTLRIGGLYHCI